MLENLRATVAEAEWENPEYQEAAAAFLDLCRKTISPAVSPADVREMLLQHILTKDIFLSIFKEDQFHRENNVARQLDGLGRTFFMGDVRREAIERLRAYYGVIGRAADEIADYAEKQQFLKAIYEDFYTAYNPAAADRLGAVHTPQRSARPQTSRSSHQPHSPPGSGTHRPPGSRCRNPGNSMGCPRTDPALSGSVLDSRAACTGPTGPSPSGCAGKPL